ncbi:MAG: hypothetical protein WCH78_12675, partial [Bacteroidota bacterium]
RCRSGPAVPGPQRGPWGCKPTLIPQTEEDITSIEWTKPEEIAARLNESFDSIRAVLESSDLKY